MSFFEQREYVTFSAISGVITLGGRPVSGARVERVGSRMFSSGHDTAELITGEDGQFSFPAVSERSFIAKYIPGEFVAPQKIFVTYEGMKYTIWEGVKRTPENNSEARGKPLVVECGLDKESAGIIVDGGFYYTKCTWDVEPDED